MCMSEIKEILVETTGGEFPPHTYYLDEQGKLAAFKKFNEDTIKYFGKPLMFAKRGRKFKKVKE